MDCMEAVARADVPELVDRRPGFRHWHVHARRRCGVADGVARSRASAGSSHSDGVGVAVLSAGAACGGPRRYLRSAQADRNHGSMDGLRGDGDRGVDAAALDYAVDAATLDGGSFHWRCTRSSDVARDPTRSCAPRRLAAGHCAERH